MQLNVKLPKKSIQKVCSGAEIYVCAIEKDDASLMA